MNKEQIEQAAKAYADLVTDNKTDWDKAYKHYLNGLQSDAAKAYHGQGCSDANKFEAELYDLINKYVNAGLKKTDLVHKMKYVTESCVVS